VISKSAVTRKKLKISDGANDLIASSVRLLAKTTRHLDEHFKQTAEEVMAGEAEGGTE
jgi:hypothetical protein